MDCHTLIALEEPVQPIAMELMEPIAVNVVLPSGEQVAQLMVNPEKPIMQMKTQIAGLEGVRSDFIMYLMNSQFWDV